MKRQGKHFTGTVDQLLEHCANMDLNAVQEQVDTQNRASCIDYIRKESGCSKAEAEKIYEEICLLEVNQTVDKLVADGLLQIGEYDADGEPKFILTELGKQVHNQMEQPVKKPVKKTAKKKKKQ